MSIPINLNSLQIREPIGPPPLNLPPQTKSTPTEAQQIEQALFGRPPPRILNPADYPEVAAALLQLKKYLRKLSFLAGDHEDDYQLMLAEDVLAAVDARGLIYFGLGFLRRYGQNPQNLREFAVLIGALAHEVGHRPKQLRKNRRKHRFLSLQEKQAACLEEEILADSFAGYALSELDLPPMPLVECLKEVQITPHPEYLDAQGRAEVILKAYDRNQAVQKLRKKLYPDFNRNTSAKNHIITFS